MFCTILITLENCNTKDRIDTSNFGQFWRCFMMYIIYIIIWDDRGDKIVQETLDFDIINHIYRIKKLNLNLMDHPCTPTRIHNRKINENVDDFEKVAYLEKFVLKQY